MKTYIAFAIGFIVVFVLGFVLPIALEEYDCWKMKEIDRKNKEWLKRKP